jgi:4'-phosphopantetheinyl transferase
MLLFSRNINAGLRFAAWQISEGEAFFRDDLPLTTAEITDLGRHQHPVRRLEWLAGRWLLHRLTGRKERLALAKNLYSKPFFLTAPQLHCSLSHSQGTVAALLSDQVCGCDIQVLVEKMPRIAPKFMRPDEFEWVDRDEPANRYEMIHLFWTAKEAMYKAHGLKELDFRAHLFLAPFIWHSDDLMETNGWIEKGDLRINYHLFMGYFQEAQQSFVWTVAATVV